MAEMTDNRRLVSVMNSLIELDFDTIEAYAAAIERLKDAGDKAVLERFMEDHRRHVSDLSPLVRSLGGTPAAAPDLKQILTKGKVVIAGLVGDNGVLEAMKSNAETTSRVYERATREPQIPARVLSVLDRNLADERRHRAWLMSRLEAKRAASGALGRM
jgi:uncharacterized protein (TIGR02284 family)